MQQPNIRDQADVKCQDAHLCKAVESDSNTDRNKDQVTDLPETKCALVGAQKQQAFCDSLSEYTHIATYRLVFFLVYHVK